jgi:IS5 family transposase
MEYSRQEINFLTSSGAIADSEFSSRRRQIRKEIFLSRMDALLPWTMLLELIEPVYPKAGNDRLPYPLQTMFRIHCLQH